MGGPSRSSPAAARVGSAQPQQPWLADELCMASPTSAATRAAGCPVPLTCADNGVRGIGLGLHCELHPWEALAQPLLQAGTQAPSQGVSPSEDGMRGNPHLLLLPLAEASARLPAPESGAGNKSAGPTVRASTAFEGCGADLWSIRAGLALTTHSRNGAMPPGRACQLRCRGQPHASIAPNPPHATRQQPN